MAKLSEADMVYVRQVFDEAVTNRRRSAAKSVRPEFKQIYDKEISELHRIKALVETINVEVGKSGSQTR